MPYKDPAKQREYQRKWMEKRRADFFAGKACVRCGSTDQLELDHKDPKLKVSHRIFSWSETRRNQELTKCQILCFFCHKDKIRENRECIRGSQVNHAKLTEDVVKEIRTLHASGRYTTVQLGELFAVDASNIGYIVRRQTWQHVE